MKRALILSAVLLALPVTASAQKPSLNVVQECQAVLDFTYARVGQVKRYDKKDVKTVQKGVKAYNDFLQSEHITPGLLGLTGGDKKAAKGYQNQIGTYKAQVVLALSNKHMHNRIFTDQAIAIDNCYSKVPMDEKHMPMMKETLETIVKLARQG